MYIVTNIKLSCQSKHICKYTFMGQLKKRPMKVTKINEKVMSLSILEKNPNFGVLFILKIKEISEK